MGSGGWEYKQVRLFLVGASLVSVIGWEMAAEKRDDAEVIRQKEHSLTILILRVACRVKDDDVEIVNKALAWWNKHHGQLAEIRQPVLAHVKDSE